jgi:hypothetical protein
LRWAWPKHAERGKRKLVAPTPKLIKAIEPAIQSRRDEGSRELENNTAAELTLILDFLHATITQQGRIRDTNGAARRARGARPLRR